MTATTWSLRPRDLVGLGQAVGPAEHGGGVAVLDDVVLGLRPRGVAGQAALAAELGEVLPAGEELVHVRLVAGVPQHPVGGGVEDAVERDRQLHHAEVGAQVPAGPGDRLDEEVADVGGQFVEPARWQRLKVGRALDVLQHRHKGPHSCRVRWFTGRSGPVAVRYEPPAARRKLPPVARTPSSEGYFARLDATVSRAARRDSFGARRWPARLSARSRSAPCSCRSASPCRGRTCPSPSPRSAGGTWDRHQQERRPVVGVRVLIS